MASFSTSSTPTGILRRKSSVDSPSGKGSIAKTKDSERHLGSPTSRTGVHFAAPMNLSELLCRAATSNTNGPVNRKVLDIQNNRYKIKRYHFYRYIITYLFVFSRWKKNWKVL